jgi:hypothetical protein
MYTKPIVAAFILSFLPLLPGAAGAQPNTAAPAAETHVRARFQLHLQAQLRIVAIVNDTGRAVRALTLAPAGGGGRVQTFQNIAPGARLPVSLDPGACAYRLRASLAASSWAVRQVDFCARASVRLSELLPPNAPGATAARPGPQLRPPPPPLPPPPPPAETVRYEESAPAHRHRTIPRDIVPTPVGAAPAQASPPATTTAAPPAAEGSPYCEVLQRPAPRSECDVYTLTVQRLRSGSAGLLAPKMMLEGETRTVSLAVSRGADRSADLLGAEPSQRFSTRVSGLMAARLVGDGFSVKDQTPEVQQVSAVGGQRWDWSVTALQARRHELVVSVYVVANADDPPEKRTLLLTRRYPVNVKVPIAQRSERGIDVATEWLKHLLSFENALWAVLTAGIAVALWKLIRGWFRRRRRPKG